MAVLKGQAAIDYINAGNNDWESLTPGLDNTNYMPAFRSFINQGSKQGFNTPVTFLDAQPGTLGAFLNNIAQGIGGVINRPAEIISALQPGQKTSTGLLNASQSGAYKPYWTTPAEKANIENILQNPLGESIKAGAGIASLLIPGGGTVGSMLLRSGISGGLYGLSQNKESQNLLGDILGGTALGAATGVGASLIGKGIGKLAKTALGKNAIEGEVIGSAAGKRFTGEGAVEGEVVGGPPKIQDILSKKKSAFNYGEVPAVGEKAPPTQIANRVLTENIVSRSGIKSAFLKDAVKNRLGDIIREGNKLVPGGSNKSLNGMRKIFEVLYPDVKNRLIEAGSHVPVSNSIKNDVLDSMFKEISTSAIWTREFWDAYMRFTGAKNYADLINFETWLNNASKKFAGETTGSSSYGKQALDAFREALGNNIKGLSPNMREGYATLSAMNFGMTGIDNLLKESSKGARAYTGPFGFAINLEPITTAGRGVTSDVLNKVTNFNLPNMNNINSTLSGILGEGVPKFPAGIGALSQMTNDKNQSNLTTPLSTEGMPNLSQPKAQGTNADLQKYLASISGTAGTGTTGSTGMTQAAQSSINPNYQMILGLLASGMKASDVKIIADLLGLSGGTQGKQLTTAAAEKITDTQTSLEYLDELEKAVNGNANRFGLIPGSFLGDVAQGLGLDPQRAYIQSQINTIAQIIGKALEGGKLTDQDILRYRQMLPTLSDTPQNAIAKINSLRVLLKSRLGSQVTGYQNAGYSAQDMLDALNSVGAQ